MCNQTIFTNYFDTTQLSLVRDEWTGRLFMSSEPLIREAFARANSLLIHEGDLSYNDLMDQLGLNPVLSGHEVGWSGDLVEPVIKAGIENTPLGVRPVLTLDFSRTPQPSMGMR